MKKRSENAAGFKTVGVNIKHRHLLLRFFPNRTEWKRLLRPFFWATASGLAFRFAFPPFEQGWIAWFGLAPFLFQFRQCSGKEGGWIAIVFGMAYFYPNLLWLNYLYHFDPRAPLGIVLAAAICTAYLVPFGVLATTLRPASPLLRFFFLPALWVLMEYCRGQLEIAFPWMYLGHTQVGYPLLIQIADLAGVYGISFLLALLNMAFAETFTSVRRRRFHTRLLAEWGICTFLAAATLIYGFHQLGKKGGAALDGKPFQVAILQPGVDQRTKLASYADPSERVRESLQRRINENLESELLALNADVQIGKEPQPDLYILPESAVTDSFFNASPTLVEMVQRWADTVRRPVFFGANRYEFPREGEPGPENPGAMYNSAYLVRPGKGLDEYYDKIHLVPFGEYSTYFRHIPFLARVLAILDFQSGTRYPLFRVGEKSFGGLICFESCFPYLFRPYDRQGADFMVVLTNDAWYGLTSGPRRHQTQAIFRAIETRRPIVRAANTGISCIIDPWGEVTAELPLMENRALRMVAPLPLRPFKMKGLHTVYMRSWGEWLIGLCAIYCALLAILAIAGAVLEKSQLRQTPHA